MQGNYFCLMQREKYSQMNFSCYDKAVALHGAEAPLSLRYGSLYLSFAGHLAAPAPPEKVKNLYELTGMHSTSSSLSSSLSSSIMGFLTILCKCSFFSADSRDAVRAGDVRKQFIITF
jgi:hypothetical protein